LGLDIFGEKHLEQISQEEHHLADINKHATGCGQARISRVRAHLADINKHATGCAQARI